MQTNLKVGDNFQLHPLKEIYALHYFKEMNSLNE